MDRTRLSPSAIADALRQHPAWREDGDAIRRDLVFADFDGAIAFIVAMADVARRLDHHPNLSNVYNEVTLRVTTHDSGGVTALDIAFAQGIDAILRSLEA